MNTAHLYATLGDPSEHEVPGHNGTVLSFAGWLLGEGSFRAHTVERGVDVDIYATVAGKVITHVHHWMAEGINPDRDIASVHRDGLCALKALCDKSGRMGHASREAWEQACDRWPDLEEDVHIRID